MGRRAIGARLRHEIFKRDGFKCVYCAAEPPEVRLCVDHLEPVSAGGTNEPWNLVTACFDCNAGKSNIGAGNLRLGPNPIQRAADLAVAAAKKMLIDYGSAGSDCTLMDKLLADFRVALLRMVRREQLRRALHKHGED